MNNFDSNTSRRLNVLKNHIYGIKNNKNGSILLSNQYTSQSNKINLDAFIVISSEVKNALENGNPIVALESTIITHGMPYPSNVETAIQVENVIRDQGATPATIAIMNGKIHVGLSKEQIEELAQQKHVVKCSRREIAFVCSKGLWGSTTVAATMIVCHMVGISVFVTGGIGGVHRGVEETMDISADLMELGMTPIAVICAGVKSILDIPKTLEVLETQGVTVASYQTDDFPAFFTRSSGCKAPCRLDTSMECAKLIHTSQQLGLQNGVLIAVPVPKHQEANAKELNNAIDKSILEAKEKGISGKEATPFLLKRVNELSGGESLQSNIALIKNNAKVGGQISVDLSKLKKKKSHLNSLKSANDNTQIRAKNSYDVTCIGGSVVDITGKSFQSLILETSNPGETYLSMGGVGRNVAEALKRLGNSIFIISAVGNDSFGKVVLDELNNIELQTNGIKLTSEFRTAIYSSILDRDGNLSSAIADMEILSEAITPQWISQYENFISSSKIIFMDANISIESMKYVAQLCKKWNKPLFFEPTSVVKAKKAVESEILSHITYLKPNKDELFELSKLVSKRQIYTLEEGMQVLHDAGVKIILCTSGSEEIILSQAHNNDINFIKIPVPKVNHIVSVNGAGDSFCAGFITGLLKKATLEKCVLFGCTCAQITLQCKEAVSKKLNEQLFNQFNSKDKISS